MNMDSHGQLANPIMQEQQLMRLLNLGIVIAALATALLIFLTIAGYGHAQLTGIPAGAVVAINGHHITTSTLKMRPGNYTVTVTSPTTDPYQGSLHIGLFTRAQFKPSLKARSADAIASTLFGAIPGSTLPVKFGAVKWFDGNTWFAGSFTPDDVVVAIHFDRVQQQWVVSYASSPAYPQDITALPAPVASYVQSLLGAQEDV